MSFMVPPLDQKPLSIRLRALIDDLILFGRMLIETLQVEPDSEGATRFMRRFRTSDIAAAIARITRGIMLAAALDARVVRCAKRIDKPLSVRLDKTPKQPAAKRPAQPRRRDEDAALLTRMPTAEEIAESIRRRPINAVLADIAHDLGLVETDQLFMRIFLHIQRTPGAKAITRLLRPRIDAMYPARRKRREQPPAPAATPSPLPSIATGPPFFVAV
jgi:hypothetical protein